MGAQAVRHKALNIIKVGAARELQQRELQSPLARATATRAALFTIPQDDAVDWTQSSIADEMAVIDTMKQRYRRPGTWKRLEKAWLVARNFMRTKMRAMGVRFCVTNVVNMQKFAEAAVVHAYQSSTAISAVSTTTQAIKMALAMSGFNPECWKPMRIKIVSQVCSRERSREARKSFALTVTQARQIHAGWGASSSLVERMIAAAITLAFLKLLRFSDFSLVYVGSIYWMGKRGFAYAIVRRKPDQRCIGEWHTVADLGTANCFARSFKRLVQDLYPRLIMPAGGWGFATGVGADRFVFKGGGRPRGGQHTHRHMVRARETVVGDGRLPISCDERNTTYQWYRRKLHLCLSECCKLTQTQAECYGTQSMRRGGNSALWRAGASKERRLKAGNWATESMDDEYLQSSIDDDLQFSAQMGV